MKDTEPRLTPREAAEDFLGGLIERGHTYQSLLESHSAVSHERYSATIGGTIFNGSGSEARYQPLDIDQVGVWRLYGEECWAIFPLIEVYGVVYARKRPDRDDGSAMGMKALFGEDALPE
jgi:hypothetical protein